MAEQRRQNTFSISGSLAFSVGVQPLLEAQEEENKFAKILKPSKAKVLSGERFILPRKKSF